MRHSIRWSLIGLEAVFVLVVAGLPGQAQVMPGAERQASTSAARQAPPAKPPKPAKPKKPPLPPDPRRWDIEFHGNFGFGGTSSGGSGALPAPGEAFTTNGGSPSRKVPSWYFGDGATLFNDVLKSFNRSERLVPLDAALTKHAADHEVRDGFGVRVTRKWKPHMSFEIAVDVAGTSFTVIQAARDGLKDASDSFPGAFAGLFATGQGVAFTNPSLSSSFGVTNGSGTEIVTTGSLMFSANRPGRLRPYAVVGGGMVSATGAASAQLTGHYAFSLPSGGRVDETDSVTIRFAGGNGLAIVSGAGLDVRLSRGSGIRVDGRVHVLENHVQTIVDTRPSAVASLPADAIWSSLTPGIQFITNPSTGLTSSLTAPGLSGFKTLSGSGFYARFNVTIGYFWRF